MATTPQATGPGRSGGLGRRLSGWWRALRLGRRWVPVALCAAAGTALGIVLFQLVIDREEGLIEREHQRTAQAQIAAIEAQLAASLHTLTALQGLLQFDPKLDEDEFRAFYEIMLGQARTAPAVRLVEWLRDVPAAELADYERQMRRQLGASGFFVWQPGPRNTRRPATGRPVYQVVERIEPREEHGTVRGLDSGHSEQTREAIWRARRTGRLAATAGFRLAQDPPGKVSVIVYAPVCPSPRELPRKASCSDPLGLAAIGISVQRLLDMARVPGARAEFAVEIFDEGVRGDEWVRLAAHEGSSARERAWKMVSVPPVVAVIPLADRRWHVVCSGAYPLPWARTWPAWLLLGTSLLITAAVQILLVSLQRQNARVQEEVRRRTRQLRRAMRLARAASEAKSQFLAKISHEIRTPLNGIIGMTHLLLDSRLDAGQRESAQVILSAGRHLLAVVNDTLDLSKIEAGKLALEKEPFELPSLLRECEQIYQPVARQKGIEFRSVRGPGLPEWALGDATRLRQILWNLISNAVKFTEDGFVELAAQGIGKDGRVRFEVRDTGCGIAEEDLQRLFQPYFQSRGSARRQEGTGLGLAISGRLVQLMEGEMGCESRVGSGSLFWFEVPLPACEPPGAVPVAAGISESAPLEGVSVLLAEDNPVNQKVLGRLLERLGCRVMVANDGHEALEAAQRNGFAVIFMDCQMPRMDGYEAARRIRQQGGRLARVPIIALTAHAMESDRQRCLDAGMNDYVAKPVSLDSLRAAIERALASAPQPALRAD